jgi:hypothetical protein
MAVNARGGVARYLRDIRSSTDRHATWLPGDRIDVGEIRISRHGRTERVSSLQDLGIPFEVEEGDVRQQLKLISATIARVDAVAGADAGLAAGEFRFDFANEGDFVFDVSNLRELRLASREAVFERVLDAAKSKVWRSKWLLVEAVYAADSATIFVSQDKSCELVLEAKAANLATDSFADPRAGLKVARHRGQIIQVLADHGVRPLFRAWKIRSLFFGEHELGPVLGSGPSGHFREPTVDELLTDD